MKFKLNKKLWPMKAHYFLYNGGTAPVVPFMPTYAKQLGFSSIFVGTLYTILPIAGMFAKPIFGALADRLKLHKQFFMTFLALTGIIYFGIKFIPETSETIQKSSLVCGAETFIKSCNLTSDKCTLDRLLAITGNKTTTCNVDCSNVASQEWYDELCHSWGLNEYCVPHTNETFNLKFTAEVPLHHTQVVKDCIFFRAQTASFEQLNSLHPYCNDSITTNDCKVECDDATVNEVLMKRPIQNESTSMHSANLWTFSLCMLFAWVSMAVVVSIGDAICFELLGDKPANYGQQRVWGSVGWGIFSVLSGYLVDWASIGQAYKNYDVVFSLTLGILAVNFLVAFKLEVQQTKMSASILRDVSRLVSEARINIFLIWCIAIGMCTGLLWNFLFWHLEELAVAQGCDAFTWIKTLQGLVMGVQCFGGELPFFFISGWVLKKIGHVHAMSLVLLGFGIRFILYYFLVNPWWVLPIELLNGVTFGIFYATMASYASIVAPPGTEATVQGFVGAVFEGIGTSLGSFTGGLLFNSVGGARTFRIFGVCSLILFILHVPCQIWLERRRQSRGEPALHDEKELQMTARYATPSDAIQMLDDPHEQVVIS